LGPSQPPVQRVPDIFAGGEADVGWCWPPPPSAWAFAACSAVNLTCHIFQSIQSIYVRTFFYTINLLHVRQQLQLSSKHLSKIYVLLW